MKKCRFFIRAPRRHFYKSCRQVGRQSELLCSEKVEAASLMELLGALIEKVPPVGALMKKCRQSELLS